MNSTSTSRSDSRRSGSSDRFEVIDELPKTSVGKFHKKRLRSEFL